MLYTVQQYMDSDSKAATNQQVWERLGPLIRCQHLSHYWLLLSVLSESADSMPLAKMQPQLKQLRQLKGSCNSSRAEV